MRRAKSEEWQTKMQLAYFGGMFDGRGYIASSAPNILSFCKATSSLSSPATTSQSGLYNICNQRLRQLLKKNTQPVGDCENYLKSPWLVAISRMQRSRLQVLITCGGHLHLIRGIWDMSILRSLVGCNDSKPGGSESSELGPAACINHEPFAWRLSCGLNPA